MAYYKCLDCDETWDEYAYLQGDENCPFCESIAIEPVDTEEAEE